MTGDVRPKEGLWKLTEVSRRKSLTQKTKGRKTKGLWRLRILQTKRQVEMFLTMPGTEGGRLLSKDSAGVTDAGGVVR